MGIFPIKGATVRGPRGDVIESFMKASLRRQNQQWDSNYPKNTTARLYQTNQRTPFLPLISPLTTPLSTSLYLISNPLEAETVRG